MATYDYTPGLGYAAAYQVAGTPYVSGGIDASTVVGLVFPAVTGWIIVSNEDGNAPCRVGFSANGVGNSGTNYIEVPENTMSPRLEVKVTEVWLSGSNSVDVLAGLTGIDSLQINNAAVSPSGSNWSGSLFARIG